MRKFSVNFGFGENICQIQEWQTMDGLDAVEAENAEEAAKWAACTDGLEKALFRVFRLTENEFGGLEKDGEPEYFEFSGSETGDAPEEWIGQESILVDTIRGNQVIRANRMAWRSQFSSEEWAALLAGEEVPVDFDGNGNPVEWETLHEEES